MSAAVSSSVPSRSNSTASSGLSPASAAEVPYTETPSGERDADRTMIASHDVRHECPRRSPACEAARTRENNRFSTRRCAPASWRNGSTRNSGRCPGCTAGRYREIRIDEILESLALLVGESLLAAIRLGLARSSSVCATFRSPHNITGLPSRAAGNRRGTQDPMLDRSLRRLRSSLAFGVYTVTRWNLAYSAVIIRPSSALSRWSSSANCSASRTPPEIRW